MTDLGLATAAEIIALLGQRLKAQRIARSITQVMLASRAGVSVGAIKKMESSGQATLTTMVKMAQALSLADDLGPVFATKPVRSIAEMERAALPAPRRARRSAE